MRNLTKTLAVVSLLAPAGAQALGLGDIKLHSALNQKLNAEIRVQAAADDTPADLKVRLASPEKFDEAGVPWNYFLSKIKFDPVLQADGTMVIKVTSRETLNEPFLDFLVEVTWAKGSIYREFTILLDPPEAYNQPAAPVEQTFVPPVSYQQADFSAEPLPPAAPKTRKRAYRPLVESTQAADAGAYGPTRHADTLWEIADRLRRSNDASVEQMMVALYRANPNAFSQGNINVLKAGVTLQVPDKNTVHGLSHQQALQQFRQYADGKIERPAQAATAGRAAAKQLDLVAPVEDSVSDNTGSGLQVKAGPAAETERATAGAVGSQLTESDIKLQERIEKLEQQLGVMQQLLSLKDQQIASLQNKGKPGSETVVPAEPITNETRQPVSPEVAPPSAQKTETPPTVVEQPAPQPVVTSPAPSPVQPVPPQSAPVTVVTESEESAAFDPYYLTVGGLGAGLLGVLGWLLWRRRHVEEESVHSMFSSASEIKMPESELTLAVPVLELDNSSYYDVGAVDDNSFLSEFTPSDFDAFDAEQSEVDPISEADVYLAYGRFQQAEELIRQAIADQPERDECKLKLLDIYYANDNKVAFEKYANELIEAGKRDDSVFWTKVLEMAQELIPGSAIVASAGEAKAVFADEAQDREGRGQMAEPVAAVASSDGDVDFDLPAFDDLDSDIKALQLDDAMPLAPVDHNALDFDLSFLEDFTVKSDDTVVPSDALETIEFDLESFAPEQKEITAVKTDFSTDLEAFDFDFGSEFDLTSVSDEDKVKQLGVQPANVVEEVEDVEHFDLARAVDTGSQDVSAKSSEANHDEFDFNFDFDTPILGSGENEIGLGVGDLTDMDEFETKIDLAKAYVDMGDIEAARSIAQDVAEKGSSEQKIAAQALLDELQ